MGLNSMTMTAGLMRPADARRMAPVLEEAHVLIAEDNAVNMQVAAFHLEDLGCVATCATNGAFAVEAFSNRAFDYVLMDCQMPVLDGFQALAQIRAFEVAAKRPAAIVIAVTAADDTDSQVRCADAGFDGFLAKPFTAAQLRSAMQNPFATRVSAGGSASGTPAVSEFKTLPILDTTAFDAFVSEFGIEVAQSLLGSFVKSLGDCKTRFLWACGTKDTAELQALAHKIAGAAGTVGAAEVATQARALEGACKRGQFKWTPAIALFGGALDHAIEVFQPLTHPGALEPRPV